MSVQSIRRMTFALQDVQCALLKGRELRRPGLAPSELLPPPCLAAGRCRKSALCSALSILNMKDYRSLDATLVLTVEIALKTALSRMSPLIMVLWNAAFAPFFIASSNKNGLDSVVRTITAISG